MINLIAAVSEDGVLGLDNKLPWVCKADMNFFKRKTTGSTVIMGRKTYESIGKPLPNRQNIVLSSQAIQGVETCSSLELALKGHTDAWIIGGAGLYREAITRGLCDSIYLNKIHITIAPTVHQHVVYMPWIDNLKYCNCSIAVDESNDFTTYTYLKL